jgi:hypothetical protein
MSVFLDVDKYNFETVLCPVLGYVSFKACDHCRLKDTAECPRKNRS